MTKLTHELKQLWKEAQYTPAEQAEFWDSLCIRYTVRCPADLDVLFPNGMADLDLKNDLDAFTFQELLGDIQRVELIERHRL